jgi:hypothetical protein
VLCGVVLAEVIHGIKIDKELKATEEALTALAYVETEPRIWQKTGEALRSLRQKGIILPLTDVLLAILALENNLEIFTTDTHFQK